MSFLFNPFPYDDPNAVNIISNNGIDLSTFKIGNAIIAKKLGEIAISSEVIGIDGYSTAPMLEIARLIKGAELIPINSIYKSYDELKEIFRECIPEDLKKDPILLYGKVFDGEYCDIFDKNKLAALKIKIQNRTNCIVLYGNGALSDELISLCTIKIFADITSKKAVLNIKDGKYRNLGSKVDLPFQEAVGRSYYIDFILAFHLRWKLLREGLLDYYIAADHPDVLTMLPLNTLLSVITRTLDYPFRCRPVYNEGVWGGYAVMSRRNLPVEMKNCAWVYDLIPMEVSTVIIIDNKELEVPFYTIVQAAGDKLMGSHCLETFNGYFPIRFNYDDTYHGSGNMSIQLHPGEKFVTENHNELGRQDESYYVVETAQNAKTYLGFRNGVDPESFISDVKKSEKEHTMIDYDKYIHSVDSKPGKQIMIPAGTIHASGRNQLILEIGSLTIGSYTYKMYDYLRKDLNGKARPIHSYYGEKNLNRDMTEEYVTKNLVNGGRRVIREGDGWCEIVVGECEQLYFSLRNLVFGDYVEDNTNGRFHVLALVDGEQIEVRSKSDHSLKFTQNYLDVILVPASIGEYEIINKKPGTKCVLHKTLIK